MPISYNNLHLYVQGLHGKTFASVLLQCAIIRSCMASCVAMRRYGVAIWRFGLAADLNLRCRQAGLSAIQLLIEIRDCELH